MNEAGSWALEAPLLLVRALRAAGVPAGTGDALAFVEAFAALGTRSSGALYWAGRLTLCASDEDIAKYDRVFASYGSAEQPRHPVAGQPTARVDGLESRDDGETQLRQASDAEVVRHLDIAELSQQERRELEVLLQSFPVRVEQRRTRRYTPLRGHRIDRARSIRAIIRAGGEPTPLVMRRRRRRPRRLVFLIDVSGSMELYAETLLWFAHGIVVRSGQAPVEVFTIGTRLTRITEALRRRDAEQAMSAVAHTLFDYKGGTRLGILLKEFLDRWGQRGLARGAVVVILSDGWERGDASILRDQMARLSRLAHRVVWANPRKGKPNYAPLAAGMAAALPYIDDFVEGHSFAALERLAKVVGGAAAPGAGRDRRSLR